MVGKRKAVDMIDLDFNKASDAGPTQNPQREAEETLWI